MGRTLGRAWRTGGRDVTSGAARGCGDLAGKVLIDPTDPLSPDFSTLEVGLTPARAELGTDFGFGLLRGRA